VKMIAHLQYQDLECAEMCPYSTIRPHGVMLNKFAFQTQETGPISIYGEEEFTYYFG
jgi:hypothetical protein